MSLTKQELVDLERLKKISDELKNHEDCGGGWVCFGEIEHAVSVVFKNLQIEIGRRLCSEHEEKVFIEKEKQLQKFKEKNL